jgi:hypothetical protein
LNIRELLRLLWWPLVGICLLVSAHAFFAHYTQGRSKLLDYLNEIVDLCEERTFGSWFESLLFVFTGLSFFLVSCLPALPTFGKPLLLLMALGFCFLSVDEALSLHEFMGYELEQATGIVEGTALDQRGYSWVLLYAPIALVVFAFIFHSYRRIFKTMESPIARNCFFLGWGVLGLVVLFEAIAGWSILERSEFLVLPCFEEMSELVFLMLFYTANLLIAEKAEL